jgi:hypothetical protein
VVVTVNLRKIKYKDNTNAFHAARESYHSIKK